MQFKLIDKNDCHGSFQIRSPARTEVSLRYDCSTQNLWGDGESSGSLG